MPARGAGQGRAEIDRTDDEPPPSERRGDAGSDVPDGSEVIDFDQYLPTVLSKLLGKLRRSANEFFGARYGITLLEWRILSFVAAEGPTSGYAIWTEGELDKAAVSRALRALQRRGLVAIERVPGSRRRKSAVSLSEEGRQLHADTLAEVLRRHQRLVDGMSAAEIRGLLDALRALEGRIPHMADGPVELSGFRPTKRKRTGRRPIRA